jgi:hypothetical protein
VRPAPILVFALCAVGAGSLPAQIPEISPNRVMADESATILVHGLDPNERITLRAELTDGAGTPNLPPIRAAPSTSPNRLP